MLNVMIKLITAILFQSRESQSSSALQHSLQFPTAVSRLRLISAPDTFPSNKHPRHRPSSS